jgi:hypothetical protein
MGAVGRRATSHGYWAKKQLLRVCIKQCCGSMTFWCGSGSADPCISLMDPDPDSDPYPAIFTIDLQDANKKLIYKKSFLRILLFESTFTHHFRKIKSQKSSHKTIEGKVSLTIFA